MSRYRAAASPSSRSCFADTESRWTSRTSGTTATPLAFTFDGELTSVQQEAARALLAHDSGVFVAPARRRQDRDRHLSRRAACPQHARSSSTASRSSSSGSRSSRCSSASTGRTIGQIGGGKRKPNGRLDVAMIQSLVRRDKVDDLVAELRPGHRRRVPSSARGLVRARPLAKSKARYVVGLTATPQRRDGHHPITEMQLGPVRFTVDAKSQARARPFEHRLDRPRDARSGWRPTAATPASRSSTRALAHGRGAQPAASSTT